MSTYLCRNLKSTELNILCIDPSLRSTGVLKLKEGKITTYVIKRKEERVEALGWFLKHFAYVAKETTWDLVLIESYSFGSYSSAVTVQAEIGGIIRGIFSGYKVPIIEMPIQTWKAITGIRMKKGTLLEKSDYLNKVQEVVGYRFETTDEADAFLMFWSLKEISRNRAGKYGHKIKDQLEGLWIKI